jgi:hypothetical protein
MSRGEPFGQERWMVCAWSCLVLVAVVVLALHDAPAPIVIGPYGVPSTAKPPPPRVPYTAAAGAFFPDGWSSRFNTQTEKAEESEEKAVS